MMAGDRVGESWFSRLVGFPEGRSSIREHLTVQGETLTSAANGRTFQIGTLTTPSLSALRSAVGEPVEGERLRVRQVVADVTALHQDAENIGALFQVASQFNLLEMTGPDRTPEDGVTGYAYDRTQGPACAIAAGPATIYRNYFVPVGSQRGQTAAVQLDMLADLGQALGNDGERLWQMRNGYALCTDSGLVALGQRLAALAAEEREALKGRLRIGIHRDVEVTVGAGGGPVSQAFCSALPVAYGRHPSELWAPFARLVLEAAYEATLSAGLLSAREGRSRKVYLTLLGGGAFGNPSAWILDAMDLALRRYAQSGLDVAIVSYRVPDAGVEGLLRQLVRVGVAVPP